MEFIQTTLRGIWNFLLFAFISLVFIPAWLIVNTLQKFWSKRFEELFS